MMPYKRRQQHLGEVDGLNTGGQLRRARDGDDDEEALAAGVPTINAGEPPASSLALAVGAAAAAAAGGSRAAGMQEGDGSASSDSSAAASTQDNVAQEDEVAISGATLAPGGDPAPMCLEAQQHLGQPDAQRPVRTQLQLTTTPAAVTGTRTWKTTSATLWLLLLLRAASANTA